MPGASVVEVLGVYVLSAVLGRWAFASWTGWALSYLNGLLLIAVPTLILLVTRRSWAAYGFTTANWRASLELGLVGYVLSLIPWVLGFRLIRWLGGSYTTWSGALVLAGAYLVISWLLVRMLVRRDRHGQPRRTPSGRANLVIVALLLLLPLLLAAYRSRLTATVASTVAWQFMFSGFGEEIHYRGYFQSRINAEFGRPWRVGSIPVGPGLIVAALLFGVSHVLNPFNPFIGKYECAWWWGLWTFCSGMFFGLLRERSDSLVAPGLAHGLPDAVGEGLAAVFGWRI